MHNDERVLDKAVAALERIIQIDKAAELNVRERRRVECGERSLNVERIVERELAMRKYHEVKI